MRIYLLVLFSVVLGASTATCALCADQDRLCGPRSLAEVCARLGSPITLEEATEVAGVDTAGSTLAELCAGAKAKGLHALPVKMSAKELSQLKTPAIAWVVPNHFVAVEGGNAPGTLRLLGQSKTEALGLDEFEAYYTGFALVIAKEMAQLPSVAGQGPDIRLASCAMDMGFVDPGSVTKRDLACRNAGDKDIVITGFSCHDACAVSMSTPTIPPGKTERATVSFDSSRLRGYQDRTVYIHSNDAETPAVPVVVSAYVRPDRVAFYPADLRFGAMPKRGDGSLGLVIPDSSQPSANYSDRKLIIKSLVTDSPYCTAVISHQPDVKQPYYLVTVRVCPDAPCGTLRAHLSLLAGGHKAISGIIPITATITPLCKTQPDVIFFGIVKQGKGSVSYVTISTVSKDPLKIGKIDNPLDCVTVEVKPKTEGKEYVLTATLKPDAPLGNIKGEVTVHTDDPDQPEIKIPVYAYVEK